MNDTKKGDESEDKLRLKAPRRIVLKKTVEEGSIKQSFAHGRSKSVVVEVRRKRTFVKAGPDGEAQHDGDLDATAATGLTIAGRDHPGDAKSKPHVLVPMSSEQKEAYQVELEQKRQKLLLEQQELSRQEQELQARRELQQQEAERQATLQRQEAEEKARQAFLAAALATPEVVPVRAELSEPPLPESVSSVSVPSGSVAEAPPASLAGIAARVAGEAPDQAPILTGAIMGAALADQAPPEQLSPVTPPAAIEQPAVEFLEPQLSLPAAAEMVAVSQAEESYVEVSANKKKLTRAQREEMARRKSEDLVTRRLSEVEDMRALKRVDEQKKLAHDIPPIHVVATISMAATAAATVATTTTAATTAATVAVETVRRPTKIKAKTKATTKATTKEEQEEQQEVPGGQRRPKYKSFRPPVKRYEPAVVLGPVVREVIIPDMITVGELANRMAVKSSDVIKLLMSQGTLVTINQVIDQDTAILVVEEMGHKAKPVSEDAAIDAELADSFDSAEELQQRPPVVTVMGHVDHGKTSLLDAIRKTDITSQEFGGITQHIGAYQVTMSSGARITFLDTPGHAAFTAMRARGAKVTDLVILVVAADDGVMPQTVEAINHAKAAKVPILVAVNKIDKPGADPEKVMQQLTEYELVSEAWGGETIFVRVSAKTGEGLDTLQEMILLQSEILDLKANARKSGRGAIVEAKLDKGRGAVATCLVQNGTLHVGDIFVVGTEWGKIRGLLSDKGDSITEALPSMPVEIIGLSGVPNAGDELITVPDERRARAIASFRMRRMKEQEQAKQAHANLGDIFDQIRDGAIDELKVVIKGDVQGSVEAVTEALLKISHPNVRVSVIHTGVGGINESDIMLGVASDAIVVGFNVRADAKARSLAKQEGIDLRFYNIIYNLVDDVTKALEGMLRPTIQETIQGHALIKEVFRISKVGSVAGCIVSDGVVQRQALVRLVRDNVVVFEGTMSSLKHFKDDIREVKEGMDCGITLERYNDYKAGDIIEAYVQEEVRQAIGG